MTPSFTSLAGTSKYNIYYGSKDVNGEMQQCCKIKGRDFFLFFWSEQKLLKGGRRTGRAGVH